MTHVVIIGGGAAGLAAAAAASGAGAQVTLLEAKDRVGKSILATGNGRCNLTNMQMSPLAYSDPEGVTPLLEKYTPARVRMMFEDFGLISQAEDDGRVYPASNTASSVLDVLRNACKRRGVHEVCDCHVASIEPAAQGFNVHAGEEMFHADRVIVTVGGGVDLLSGIGHTVTPFSPVLCSLATDTKPLRGLSGLRAKAMVSVYRSGAGEDPIYAEPGEVLFRDYGLSGIVIFDISRVAKEGDILSLDLLPVPADMLETALHQRLEELRDEARHFGAPGPTYSDLLCGMLHARINDAVLRAAGCRPTSAARAQKFGAIARAFKDLRVQVKGVGDTKHAQVTRGGAVLSEFDPIKLESKLHPGLYAAGETLDVDGVCGGYNLHWAWASGTAAGLSAAAPKLRVV